MFNTIAQKVRQAFSDAADQYDILTSLHKEIGRELVKKVMRLDAPIILDVGCGTGYAANKAKFFFPESRIIGLDIAEGMLAKAAQLHEGVPIDWVQGDLQALPLKDSSVDLIVSNLAYQWGMDMPAAFAQARRVLTPAGVLNINLFGARTCQELFASLKVEQPDLLLRSLPTEEAIVQALAQAGFVEAKVDAELIKVEFRDVMELLGWLKAIGANHLAIDRIFLGKQMLGRLNDHYRREYPYHGGIAASFEVIWAYAKK